jgi:hypothetical protein
MKLLDLRYIDASPLFNDRFIQRDEPVPVEEMARREVEHSTIAEAVEHCRVLIEGSEDEEEANYWTQVRDIIAAHPSEPEPRRWQQPCSPEEMAAELLCEEGLDEALELCRSELRTAIDPERLRYFKLVEALVSKQARFEDDDQLPLLLNS